MIQTSFFPQPKKDEPVKIIQIAPSGLQPKKVEEINYRSCADLLPDTYMIYPTGGYHPFYGVPNTLPRYQLPIWPCIRRINWPKQPRKYLLGHLQSVLHPKTGYITISLQKKGYYNSNHYVDNWSGPVPNQLALDMHGLVANAYVPNPDNKPQVMHINDDPTNYLPENLKWGTPGENMKGVRPHPDSKEQKYLALVDKGLIKG
jgi:hypothetical protein